MEIQDNKPVPPKKKSGNEDQNNTNGLPQYTNDNEDIYPALKEEKDVVPEEIVKKKSPVRKPGTKNEQDFSENLLSNDVDIPADELNAYLKNSVNENSGRGIFSFGGYELLNYPEERDGK